MPTVGQLSADSIFWEVLFFTITQNKYYSNGVITKRKNFNCLVVETSESIETNDNDLELNASLRSKIFQTEVKQFLQ